MPPAPSNYTFSRDYEQFKADLSTALTQSGNGNRMERLERLGYILEPREGSTSAYCREQDTSDVFFHQRNTGDDQYELHAVFWMPSLSPDEDIGHDGEPIETEGDPTVKKNSVESCDFADYTGDAWMMPSTGPFPCTPEDIIGGWTKVAISALELLTESEDRLEDDDVETVKEQKRRLLEVKWNGKKLARQMTHLVATQEGVAGSMADPDWS